MLRLYDIPNDFLGEELVNNKWVSVSVEKFVVDSQSVRRYMKADIAGSSSNDRPVFAEGLLQMIFKAMVRYPSTKFAVKYTGHGAEYMSFERVSYDAQDGFYPALAHLFGKKIEFLDWSTNCNAGSLYNLKKQAPYANYILANDLLWGGCSFEGMKSTEEPPWRKYSDFFTKEGTTDSQLKNYVEALSTYLNSPGKKECYAKGGDKYETPLQITLFDCRALEKLAGDTELGLDKLLKPGGQGGMAATTYYKDGGSEYGDLKTYIKNTKPAKVTLFDQAVLKQANNRSSFTWKIPAQGINFSKK